MDDLSGDFQLEAASEILGAWQLVDAPVMEINRMLQATVVMEEVNRYCRLRPVGVD